MAQAMEQRSSASTSVLAKKCHDVHLSHSDKPTWGRSSVPRSWLRSMVAASPGFFAPVVTLCIFVTLSEFNGSLSEFMAASFEKGFWAVLIAHAPQASLKTVVAGFGWVALQAALYLWLPGPTNVGQHTPAGHLLSYRTNGMFAWVVTHLLFAFLCFAGVLDPAFIPRNWSGLFFMMNVMGFLVSSFAYVKAHLMPTHADDRKFSGSAFYDFFMGIELNPRLGDNFDFKLFTNGRPGIVAWTLIDISNMAYQYQTLGHIKPSLILVTILHTIYVVDFFVNESWYLRTIDIAHDHYGFYLCWGCFCFLPSTYTIQAQFLGQYPTSPPNIYLAVIFGIGLAGYAIFRSVNNEKDRVRRTGGQCLIWGKPAEYITATYSTSDGKTHRSILLCSGWWGLSRHANYVGDLLMSFSMCALAGTTKVLVWYYLVWMTMLLVHRCKRDEQRCSIKYGEAWNEYCRRVRWRFVPGIW